MPNVVEILIRAHNTAGSAFTEVEAAAGKMNKAVAVGFAAVGIAAGVAAVESVKMASEFQASMMQLHTQAGVSLDAVNSLSDGVLSLAGKVGTDPTSLSQALYHIESSFASTGITGKHAMELLTVAAQGAKMGHADLVDVTNALDAAVVANIPGVQDLNSAMGVLNATVGAGDMNMQDLSKALGGGVLAVVKNYGLSILDVGAALALFGDNNIRGAQAGTQLRMAVQALAVPAVAGKKALADLGMTSNTLAKDMQTGGLNKAITDLHTRLVDLKIPTNEWGQIVTEIFGKRAGSGVAVLLSQYDRLQSKYVDLKKGANNFAEAWTAAQTTMSQKWDNFTATIKAGAVRLGLAMLPAVSKGLDGITGAIQTAIDKIPALFDRISKNNTMQEIVKSFNNVGNSLKSGFGDGLKYVEDAWNKMRPAVEAVWKSIGPIFKEVFTNPQVLSGLKDIAILIIGVVGAIATLVAIGASLEMAFGAAVVAIVGWVVGTLVPIIGKAISGIVSAFNSVVDFFKKLPSWISAAFNAVVTWFSGLPKKIMDALKPLPGLAASFFSKVMHDIAFIIGVAIGVVIGAFIKLPGKIMAAIHALPGQVASLFNSVKSRATSAVSSMASSVAAWASRTASSLYTQIRSGINTAITYLSALPGRAARAISGLPGAIRSAASGAGKWLYDAGVAIVRGLVDGVSSAIGWAKSQITSLLSSVSSGISSGFGLWGNASGGIIGARASGGLIGSAATGGARNGLTMVGEHGRELIRAAPGSRVYSNPDTERMLSADNGGGGGGGHITIEYVGDAAAIEFLKRLIRIRGGGIVQKAIGS